MKTILKLSLFAILAIALNSCYYDKFDELNAVKTLSGCDSANATYTKVAVIMGSYCTSCHGGSSPSGGVSLENYANVKLIVDNGKLIGCTKHQVGYQAMPPGTSLSECHLAIIKNWVKSGAPNN